MPRAKGQPIRTFRISLRNAALLAAAWIALTGTVLWSAWLGSWTVAIAAFAATGALAAAGTIVAAARSAGAPGAGGPDSARPSAAATPEGIDERLASLTHDLRSPLNACLMWVNVLALEPSQERTAEAVDALTRNLKKQAQLLDALVESPTHEAPDA